MNFALLAHRYNLLVPMHFFCLIVTFDRCISEESNSKGLFKETEKKIETSRLRLCANYTG